MDLALEQNLAVTDEFSMEINGKTVKADHFEVDIGKSYLVKAKIGANRRLKAIAVRYYGQCSFISKSNTNISGNCLEKHPGNLTAAFVCVMKQSQWMVSLQLFCLLLMIGIAYVVRKISARNDCNLVAH